MKKSIYTYLVLVLTVFAFVSCKSDDDGGSSSSSDFIRIDGQNFSLDGQGYLESYGQNSDGSYDWDVTLLSSGINYVNETGSGNIFYIDLNTSSENGLVTGTYNYSSERNEFTWVYSQANIGVDSEDSSAGDDYYIVSGTVDIVADGNNVTIEWNLETQAGETVTGSWDGTLQSYD